MALLQRFSFILFFITLISCGGGDGSLSNTQNPGTGVDDNEDVITLTLTISDKVISAQSSAIITVTAMQGSVAVADKVVTFTINEPNLAYFTTETGTVSTNANGVATIELNVGETSGSGEVVASIGSVESIPISFDSVGDGNLGSTPVVVDINLFASNQQISSSGSDAVTLTAIVKDANNNLVENATVVFSADSGQIEILNAITGPDGKAVATLSTKNESENRIITAIASSDSISSTLQVQVIGTTVSLVGSSSLAIDDDNTFVINLLNSDGEGIANTVVELSVSGVSTSSPAGSVADITMDSTVTTDFTGQAIVLIAGTSGGTNSIQASALGATISHDVTVQADSFLFTDFYDGDVINVNPSTQASASIPDVLLSDAAAITLTWLRSGTPVPEGTNVNFTTTRGSLNLNSAQLPTHSICWFPNQLGEHEGFVSLSQF